jgi:hypothetical protein
VSAIVRARRWGYFRPSLADHRGRPAATSAGEESAQLAGFLLVFPLMFASSVFVSIRSMPGWLQAFANVQPITRAANAVRALPRAVLSLSTSSGPSFGASPSWPCSPPWRSAATARF